MVKIETFVIIDLETTGLPYKEYNRTKITEMALIAASVKDLRRTVFGDTPPVCKLSFMLNPEKAISTESARITGIKYDTVKNLATFREKFNTINAFLQDLKKPVCLVAHNGNTFDYRILLAECIDANVVLPDDLLCVDSLSIFRKIAKVKKTKDTIDKGMNNHGTQSMNNKSVNETYSDIMTDDEDDFPTLNVTPEEFQEIDDLCSSFHNMSATSSKKKTKPKEKVLPISESFKLTDIFTRYFGGIGGMTAHRAEDDCLMLLRCMVAAQSDDDETDFMTCAEKDCKLLSECKALERKPAGTATPLRKFQLK